MQQHTLGSKLLLASGEEGKKTTNGGGETYKKNRKKKSSKATHHLLGAYWLCIQKLKRPLILHRIRRRGRRKQPGDAFIERPFNRSKEERRKEGEVSPLFDAPLFGWKEERDLKRMKKNRCCVLMHTGLLVKGTWPLVIAKIELELHLARRKQLCSASAHVLPCSRCHFLSSLSSALLLKPLRMTPKIIEKPAQSVTKIQTCFSRKGMGKGRGGEGETETEERLEKKVRKREEISSLFFEGVSCSLIWQFDFLGYGVKQLKRASFYYKACDI